MEAVRGWVWISSGIAHLRFLAALVKSKEFLNYPFGYNLLLMLTFGVASHQSEKIPDFEAIFTDCAGWLYWPWINNKDGSNNF